MGNITKIEPLSLFDETKQAKEGQSNFRANASYSWSWLIEHTKELNIAFNNFNSLVVQAMQTAQDIDFDVDVLNSLKEHIDLNVTNIEQITQDINNKYHSLKEHNWATKTSIGLENVDNTSDLDKPVSNATKQELDKKVDKTITVNNKALNENILLTKEDIGLENVDNTSDNEKIVKSATKWEIPRSFTIGNTSKLVDGSSDVIFDLEDIGIGTNQALKEINGWFKDSSSGIIFQWGLCKIWDYSKIHYFPISFPNQALNITFGFNDYEGIPRGGIKNRSSFVVYPSRSTRSNFYYLAIGY